MNKENALRQTKTIAKQSFRYILHGAVTTMLILFLLPSVWFWANGLAGGRSTMNLESPGWLKKTD